MIFYLGTHKPHWLRDKRFASIPLFISRRQLEPIATLPRACGRWALDSGGFTELALNGRWMLSPKAYAQQVRRYADEIGRLEWAAPQDWMCEPSVLGGGNGFVGTGLTIRDHQIRTVENLVELRALESRARFIPVLQGWTTADYLRCVEMYDRIGVDLRAEPVVGVGTMCRRQATTEALEILSALASAGLTLHGFGFKLQGVFRAAPMLRSADSMAWSFDARRRAPLPGHDVPGPGRRHGHKSCANCAEFAIGWYRRVVARTRGDSPSRARA